MTVQLKHLPIEHLSREAQHLWLWVARLAADRMGRAYIDAEMISRRCRMTVAQARDAIADLLKAGALVEVEA